MGLFRRSFGEDNADRYNHTFSVIFLLVLSLATWLLPLSSYLQPLEQSQQIDVPTVRASQDSPEELKLQLDCWCPPEFSSSMVSYTNAACNTAFNRALEGLNESHAASIYEANFEVTLGFDGNDMSFKPKMSEDPERDTPSAKGSPANGDKKNNTMTKQTDEAASAWRFIRVTVPTTLFLFALGLKIPYLAYSLLVGLLGALNVDRTLEAVCRVSSSCREDRQEIHRQIARVSAQHSRCAAGGLYLLLKILACAATIACLLVVHGSLLPQAKSLKDNLGESSHAVYTQYNHEHQDPARKLSDMAGYEYVGKPFVCVFPIRHVSNIQRFSVQCVVNADGGNVNANAETQPLISVPVTKAPVYEVYETIFLIVQTFLIVLVAINISNLVMWLAKLMIPPCRNSVLGGTDSGSLPLDAIFLLQMAHENVGPEVVADFVESGAWGNVEKGWESIQENRM